MRGALSPATRGARRVSAPESGLDVRNFPAVGLPAGRRLVRIHRKGLSPWWFSHDGCQRFDIPAPYGTCYLAESPMGAFLDTLGRLVVVPRLEVEARRLAVVTLSGGLRLADCHAAAAAGYGVTATTSAGYPYEQVSQAWARRFWGSASTAYVTVPHITPRSTRFLTRCLAAPTWHLRSACTAVRGSLRTC